MNTPTINYLRRGRKLRASGSVIERNENTRMVKVKPLRDGWGMVWLDETEIDAGKEKPAPRPKTEKPDPAKRKARAPRQKTQPLPEWKQLVAAVRIMEIDHLPDGWPAVRMKTLTSMANELEAAHAKLAELLPLNASILP